MPAQPCAVHISSSPCCSGEFGTTYGCDRGGMRRLLPRELQDACDAARRRNRLRGRVIEARFHDGNAAHGEPAFQLVRECDRRKKVAPDGVARLAATKIPPRLSEHGRLRMRP